MELIVTLALLTGLLVASYRLAEKRGRRPVLWTALALVFGVFALATLALLPSKATEATDGEIATA